MPSHKTRKLRKQKQSPPSKIQHHHLFLRMEMETCPDKTQTSQARQLIHNIVRDIDMKLLARPRVYYVENPHYNAGLTAIAPIETSHIAFHFWQSPDSKILHNPESKCLLQFDVYTCGSMSVQQVCSILHHLTHYHPTHVDVTILNRNMGLTIDHHMKWDKYQPMSWKQWLESDSFHSA